MDTLITIIIPTYNRKNHLKNILNQLCKQELDKDLKIEIIVVVDGSVDGTIEMLEQDYSSVHIIKGSGNWWFTKCINKGFEYGNKLSTDFFLLLNDDVEIENNYISMLWYSYLALQDNNAILGSISYAFSNKEKIIEAGSYHYNKFTGKYNRYFVTGTLVKPNKLKGAHKVVELPARGTLIPHKIVEELNGYDERFVQYASDTDFCNTARKRGHLIYISYDAKIFCNEQLTSIGSRFRNDTMLDYFKSYFSKFTSNSYYTKFLFIKKHYTFFEKLVVCPRVLLSPFISFILKKN